MIVLRCAVVQLLVQLWRGGEDQREDKADEQRTEKCGAVNSCRAKNLQHRVGGAKALWSAVLAGKRYFERSAAALEAGLLTAGRTHSISAAV